MRPCRVRLPCIKLTRSFTAQYYTPTRLSQFGYCRFPTYSTLTTPFVTAELSLPHHQQEELNPTTSPDIHTKNREYTQSIETPMPDTTPAGPGGPKPTHSKQVQILEDGVEKEFTAITEGKATILFPGNGEVFYNPIQNFNRDLSVLAIKTFGEQFLKEREEGRRKAKKHGGKKDRKEQKKSIAPEEEVEVEGEHEGEHEEVKPTTEQDPNAMDIDTPPKPTPPPFRILDALSATGLRALRYAHEIPFATHLTANDLSASAVASIHRNLTYNSPLNPHAIVKIAATTSPAQAHMYSSPHKYHVIDLDPYGTASPFLDSALQAIVTKDSGPGNGHSHGVGGGLLCVTCTDAGVWASTGYAEKCFALYGGMPIKGDASHEVGLRLILYSIATTAAKYGLAIEPLLSLSIDFYARVFVRVKRSAAQVKDLASKSMLAYNCDSGCGAWRTVPLGKATVAKGRKGGGFVKYGLAQVPEGGGGCAFCGFREHIGGPMWGGELHEEGFVRRLLDVVDEEDEEVYTTLPRIRGMLSTALNECTFAGLPVPVVPVKQAENVENVEGGESLEVEGLKVEGDAINTSTAINPDTPPSPTLRLPGEIETSTTNPPPVPPTPPYPPLPTPYFFVLPTRLSKTLHSISPTQASLRGALLSLGYPVGRSHCRPNSIKTTAPWIVVWEIMRQWVERFAPVKVEGLSAKGPGRRVLFGCSEEGGEDVRGGMTAAEWEEVRRKVGVVRFDEELGKDTERCRGGKHGGKREVRYQMNPTANWGPMRAAKEGAKMDVNLRSRKRKENGEDVGEGVGVEGEVPAEEGQEGTVEGVVRVDQAGKKIKLVSD